MKNRLVRTLRTYQPEVRSMVRVKSTGVTAIFVMFMPEIFPSAFGATAAKVSGSIAEGGLRQPLTDMNRMKRRLIGERSSISAWIAGSA
ncbi:hypothetical protein CNY89_01375 [Amaricoccus sp. HAR-UPW-R2A-40]|nr:hypothetical protein CNY89_01375 [Amaricoccus sp. HAR-UPW-R2A-40]